jgi:cysteinyl-tRNA synthetase
MIKLDTLDALSDSELDQIEAYSQALKKHRDDDRKWKAMDEARAILAAAGIDLKDVAGKSKKGPKKVALFGRSNDIGGGGHCLNCDGETSG